MQELDEEYLHSFYRDDRLYGLRLGKPSDAEQMVDLYVDVYGWDYLYPWVYDPEQFREALSDEKQWWIVVEPLDTKVILGGGVLKKINKYTMFAAKLVCKKKYQGKGFAGILGTVGVKSLYQQNVFDGVLRLETDIRAKTYNSQQFIETIGCVPYGYIPNYNNYADKREFDPSRGKPFTKGTLEPVVMYFRPFGNFWDKRKSSIFLYDEPHILEAYEIVKKINGRKMKSDDLYVESKQEDPIKDSNPEIIRDYHKGIITIIGYMEQDEITQILTNYTDWNIIEWRVPTDSLSSIRYQKMAIDSGFNVVGYDPCSTRYNIFADTIIFNQFPNGVSFSQFGNITLTEKSKPFAELVMDSLDEALYFS